MAIFSFSLSCSAFAWAPDRTDRLDWGIVVGGALVDTKDLDDTAYVASSLTYGVTEYIGLGLELGWWEADGNPTNKETVGAGTLMGQFILRTNDWHDFLVPYAVLGLGFTGAYVTNEDGLERNRGQDDYDGSFAWKLGGGLDWFISERWAINFEAAYVGTDPTFDSVSTDVQKVDYFTVVGGIKSVF